MQTRQPPPRNVGSPRPFNFFVLLCCGNWHAAFETEDRFVLAIVSVEGDAQQPDFNLWSFSLFTTSTKFLQSSTGVCR